MPDTAPNPRRRATLLAVLLTALVGPGCVSWEPILLPTLGGILHLLGL